MCSTTQRGWCGNGRRADFAGASSAPAVAGVAARTARLELLERQCQLRDLAAITRWSSALPARRLGRLL